MKKKIENSKEENNELPKSFVMKIFDPSRNIVREIKNMEEEIITENGKILISKKRALEIALTVIPDLEDRSIYSFSLEKPKRVIIFGGVPDDCWYITYSRNTKSSNSMMLGSSLGIFINKYTGRIMHEGSLGGS